MSQLWVPRLTLAVCRAASWCAGDRAAPEAKAGVLHKQRGTRRVHAAACRRELYTAVACCSSRVTSQTASAVPCNAVGLPRCRRSLRRAAGAFQHEGGCCRTPRGYRAAGACCCAPLASPRSKLLLRYVIGLSQPVLAPARHSTSAAGADSGTPQGSKAGACCAAAARRVH